jgi:hypothetical protein
MLSERTVFIEERVVSSVWEDPRVAAGMVKQLSLREQRTSAGDRTRGWKVVFGAPAAMANLGIDGPLVGFFTDGALLQSGALGSPAGWTKPALEPEIAIHMTSDLPGGADRVQHAGHDLSVWNRSVAAAKPFSARVIRVLDDPTGSWEHADLVITMLSDGPAVEDAALERGPLARAPACGIYMDMSTIGADSAEGDQVVDHDVCRTGRRQVAVRRRCTATRPTRSSPSWRALPRCCAEVRSDWSAADSAPETPLTSRTARPIPSATSPPSPPGSWRRSCPGR